MTAERSTAGDGIDSFWSVPLSELLESLHASADGLTTADATARLAQYGANSLGTGAGGRMWALLARQFGSPSAALDWRRRSFRGASRSNRREIILFIVAVSGLLGFWQEYDAANTAGADDCNRSCRCFISAN